MWVTLVFVSFFPLRESKVYHCKFVLIIEQISLQNKSNNLSFYKVLRVLLSWINLEHHEQKVSYWRQHLINYIIKLEYVFETSPHNRNIPPILHQTQRDSFLYQRRTFPHWFAMPIAINVIGPVSSGKVTFINQSQKVYI